MTWWQPPFCLLALQRLSERLWDILAGELYPPPNPSDNWGKLVNN